MVYRTHNNPSLNPLILMSFLCRCIFLHVTPYYDEEIQNVLTNNILFPSLQIMLHVKPNATLQQMILILITISWEKLN